MRRSLHKSESSPDRHALRRKAKAKLSAARDPTRARLIVAFSAGFRLRSTKRKTHDTLVPAVAVHATFDFTANDRNRTGLSHTLVPPLLVDVGLRVLFLPGWRPLLERLVARHGDDEALKHDDATLQARQRQ